MSDILLTAFEPFGGAPVNASLEAARLLAAGSTGIRLVELPVVAGAAEDRALAALRDCIAGGHSPSLFLSLGESSRPGVSLEKFGRNRDDFRIPDNAGRQPREKAIVHGGPDAYEATLPVERIAAMLPGTTPVPVTVSESAGAFLCNHLAYCVCHALTVEATPIPYAFVHVPAARPGEAITFDAIAQTLGAVIAAAREARRLPAG